MRPHRRNSATSHSAAAVLAALLLILAVAAPPGAQALPPAEAVASPPTGPLPSTEPQGGLPHAPRSPEVRNLPLRRRGAGGPAPDTGRGRPGGGAGAATGRVRRVPAALGAGQTAGRGTRRDRPAAPG